MKRTLVTLTAVLALLVSVAAPTGGAEHDEETTENPWLDRRVLVVAHAGGEDEAPHSTMYAYKRSHQLGVDVLEADLRMSADGVVVIHHDETVTATTGQAGTVANMTYDELFALDNAYRFTPYQWSCGACPVEDYVWRGVRTGDKAPPAGFAPEDFTIPQARQLFEDFPDDTWLDVEIKPTGQAGRDLADALIALIEEFDAADRVVIASFDTPTMDYVRAQFPDAITSPGVQELLDWSNGIGDLAGHSMVQVPPFFGTLEVVTADFVDDMHELGLAVWVWMDSKAQEDAAFYDSLIDLGVDALLVSRPGVARDVVDDRGVAYVRPPVEPSFTDVGEGHPFFADIEWMVAEGIAQGYPDGTFGPTRVVTRQAAAAFLHRLSGSPSFDPPTEPTFPDVPATHPFFVEIEFLVATGIAEGYPDGTFRPAHEVTRQAMAAFVYRTAGSPAVTSPVEGFSDVGNAHPFATEIAFVTSEGLSEGYPDGTFGPTRPMTRQAAARWLAGATVAPAAADITEPPPIGVD